MSQPVDNLLKGAVPPVRNTALFGHQQAENFLAHHYASGKMHHALLIEGPEGIGKATLGFRFAGHILRNPDHRQAPDHLLPPDPASAVVMQMAAGASHDFLYLSSSPAEKTDRIRTVIPVDEIRRIRYFLSRTSATGNWRIVMIDPTDAMNRHAANALLKILEEPPKRVLFILLSHIMGKLLPTIRSRCLAVRLSPLSEKDLLAALRHLGLSISPAQSQILPLDAGGSVAKALKLLNYNGSGIAAIYRKFKKTSPKYAARKIMHQLAEELASKEESVSFSFLVDLVMDDLVHEAKNVSLTGNLDEANRLAELYTRLQKKLQLANIYNLDHKQTILHLLEERRS